MKFRTRLSSIECVIESEINVSWLWKAFLKAGVLVEDGTLADTNAGTPQGSILSPLLSNVALSVLDDHIAQGPGGPKASSYERAKRRRQGLPNYRLARYADLC
jgi:RNA-directed DNA polymerase